MGDIELGRTAIDALATKLDSFGERLSDEEHTLLNAVFVLAGEGLLHRVEAHGIDRYRKTDRDVGLRTSAQNLSSLSSSFRKAFHSGPPAGLGINPVLFTPVPIPEG
jgi:hypothetical protein